MKKLELYYYDECPYCQIVLRAIDANNLRNSVTLCNTRQHSQHREKLMKDTGRSTVPCLYIDGTPMHESSDIARWLKEYATSLK
ncbi:MAG: glutathione S-transferase N-terminal domain-containing protein [Bacteriovoracaceae bacterium]|nr:glutathione S-transferase N-terminal domain-containing protein [Bacteriovoracaceae bacterium]